MRSLAPAFSLILTAILPCGGCAEPPTSESERAKLNGMWQVTSWERRGIEGDGEVGSRYEFFNDGTFQVTLTTGKASGRIPCDLDVSASPMHIDWPTVTIIPGKSVTPGMIKAIYRVEGDRLMICKPLSQTLPRPAAFNTKGTDDVILLTLKRVRAETK